VREPSNPVSVATMPVPDEADYCKKGGNFGPHNLWDALHLRHHAQCRVRTYDIANPFQLREIAYFVPRDPERMYDPGPSRPRVIQSCDCFLDAQGIMYLTDSNSGRMEHKRGLR
jgi:hypothetical protein